MTYKDIQGWFSYEPFYNHIAEKFLKNGMKIVEIGAFKGKSSTFLASKIKEKKLDIQFYVVDHWKGSSEHQNINDVNELFEIFLSNIKACELENYIIPKRDDSIVAAKDFPDEFFDFVFIDASHDYENVKRDIDAWLPKVKKPGILGGDDYDNFWSEVIKAVEEKLSLHNIQKDMLPAWYVNL